MLPEDQELAAMAQVLKILKELEDSEAQKRTLSWVEVRLNLKREDLPAGDVSKNDKDINKDQGQRAGTVNTVVQKLGADSCRGVLVAAATYLLLYKGKDKFTRDELVATARESRLWKSNYANQVAVNLARLCDSGEFIEKDKDVYDVAPKRLTELEQNLAA